MRWPLRSFQFLAERAKRSRIVVVSINIAEQTRKFLEGCRIHSAMFFEAVVRTRAELVERPARFCNADNRHIEMTAVQHCQQRGKDLLVGQVAGCAAKDQ